ncbi:exocyst complex component EXO70I-like [Argentina anserina]|uniref:exocyst complex component EXO70I-like n=1 Tax=Argentina anserina TaxID=57926 RepID=UPI0021765E74|nr:exocyst complex component EXO70I-like [Potentilla anserina]
MATKEEGSGLSDLQLACTDLRTLLKASAMMEQNLKKMDKKFDVIDETLTSASRRVTPLQSLSMATKALEAKINRAVTPALALLDNFKRSESIQTKLIDLSSKLSNENGVHKRLKTLIKYVDCVDQLKAAISSICEEGEPVIQRLQEVVEFLSRTKATDQYRTHRLRETLITLKALYETEVDAMRFEGLLDEALLNLQDEYESILQQIRHQKIAEQSPAADKGDEGDDQMVIMGSKLGTELEIEILKRISQILAAEDCLDICIDIYVKVRYRRVAKALMRLNPEYLRTHAPEEIDEMAWEDLETAITLWIQHFELAVKAVLVSEKIFCEQVLGGIMDGLIWPECFVKIADKIMAVFFRFGEGVARSSKEPQKLFKLLDMFQSLEKLKPAFSLVFDGESGNGICIRFRELEKLLIHASSKVFWEFGLQIEGNSDGVVPPPQDASVPKMVRYAVNYLKYLATEDYSIPMAKVLRTEQIWKAGILSRQESDENLLRDAVSNIMEALQRNVEAKRSSYKADKMAMPHVFAMNTYWYIYMRTKNTELGKLLGDQYMKKNYKVIAEESAYMYQKTVWAPLVRVLEKDSDLELESKEAMVGLIKAKMEEFIKDLDDVSKRHKGYYSIPDADLKEQIILATVKLVVPAYSEFLNAFSVLLPGKSSYLSPESVQELLRQIFEGGEAKHKRRGSRDRTAGGSSAVDGGVDFRRTRSNTSEM